MFTLFSHLLGKHSVWPSTYELATSWENNKFVYNKECILFIKLVSHRHFIPEQVTKAIFQEHGRNVITHWSAKWLNFSIFLCSAANRTCLICCETKTSHVYQLNLNCSIELAGVSLFQPLPSLTFALAISKLQVQHNGSFTI